jgi:hypothetical protein
MNMVRSGKTFDCAVLEPARRGGRSENRQVVNLTDSKLYIRAYKTVGARFCTSLCVDKGESLTAIQCLAPKGQSGNKSRVMFEYGPEETGFNRQTQYRVYWSKNWECLPSEFGGEHPLAKTENNKIRILEGWADLNITKAEDMTCMPKPGQGQPTCGGGGGGRGRGRGQISEMISPDCPMHGEAAEIRRRSADPMHGGGGRMRSTTVLNKLCRTIYVRMFHCKDQLICPRGSCVIKVLEPLSDVKRITKNDNAALEYNPLPTSAPGNVMRLYWATTEAQLTADEINKNDLQNYDNERIRLGLRTTISRFCVKTGGSLPRRKRIADRVRFTEPLSPNLRAIQINAL